MTPPSLIHDLMPAAEKLMDRHAASAKEWFPHLFVPWSRGRDFEPGVDWEPDELAPPPPVRSALFVNLLTEDNLPYYTTDITRLFGVDHAWGAWSRRWTICWKTSTMTG